MDIQKTLAEATRTVKVPDGITYVSINRLQQIRKIINDLVEIVQWFQCQTGNNIARSTDKPRAKTIPETARLLRHIAEEVAQGLLTWDDFERTVADTLADTLLAAFRAGQDSGLDRLRRPSPGVQPVSRPGCLFLYCPTPEACKLGCKRK